MPFIEGRIRKTGAEASFPAVSRLGLVAGTPRSRSFGIAPTVPPYRNHDLVMRAYPSRVCGAYRSPASSSDARARVAWVEGRDEAAWQPDSGCGGARSEERRERGLG